MKAIMAGAFVVIAATLVPPPESPHEIWIPVHLNNVGPYTVINAVTTPAGIVYFGAYSLDRGDTPAIMLRIHERRHYAKMRQSPAKFYYEYVFVPGAACAEERRAGYKLGMAACPPR